MKVCLFLPAFFLSLQFLQAQNYFEGTLYYLDGTTRDVLVHKKIEGPKIKFKEGTGGSATVESASLKSIKLKTKKEEGEAWYEYLKYVDSRGNETKKAYWLNKVIDGEVSLYMESWVAIGNPAGSGEAYYLKRRDVQVATKINGFKYVSQLSEYFKDQPEIVEKVQTKEYGPRDLVLMYNEMVE